MKTIGLIGGMSWESTQEYYKFINEKVKEELGGLHSAELILYSLDFHDIEILQDQGEWDRLTEIMTKAALKLQSAGADFIVICTNTMHKMAEDMQKGLNVSIIHIADAAGEAVQKHHLRRVGLLGTKFTMEQDFYKKRLAEKYGLDVLIPEDKDRQTIHDIIYRELCLGEIKESSKSEVLQIISRMEEEGAEGIILGCTEIPLLIAQKDLALPVFDTTMLHAHYIVYRALEESGIQL
jgi:aspartate racemase